MEKKS